MDVAELRNVDLFSSLTKRELEQLARWTDEVSVPAGRQIVSEGRFAHEFFVVVDGTARVEKDGERIAELGPGHFFGEIALLETERRTASVVAVGDMRLIVMFRREFLQMERDMPEVAERIRAAVRERLSRRP